MNMKYLLSIIVLLSFSLQGCLKSQEYSTEELQALVDTELEKKLASYRKTKMERCREQLLQEASAAVDSILFRAAQIDIDSSLIPSSIARPKPPTIRSVPDTRPIAPLFDSIRTIKSRKDT